MEKQITLSDRLRTFRTWGIWGVFGVVIVDMIVTAVAGPCGPKPDLFDWFQLVAAVLLLAQQFVIVGLSLRFRGKGGEDAHTRFEWRWDLMWLAVFGFSVAADVVNIRFLYVFPGCS